MKKIGVFILLSMFLISFVFCEDSLENISKKLDNTTFEAFTDGLKSELDTGKDIQVKNKIPDSMSGLSEFLGIGTSDEVTLEELLIYICLIVILTMVICMVLTEINIFGKKFISFLIGVIVSLLAVLSGGIKFTYNYIVNGTSDVLSLFTSKRFIIIVGVAIVGMIVFKFVFKLSKKIKAENKKLQSGNEGSHVRRTIIELENIRMKQDLERN